MCIIYFVRTYIQFTNIIAIEIPYACWATICKGEFKKINICRSNKLEIVYFLRKLYWLINTEYENNSSMLEVVVVVFTAQFCSTKWFSCNGFISSSCRRNIFFFSLLKYENEWYFQTIISVIYLFIVET